MLTKQDAITCKVFYHKTHTFPNGRPLRCKASAKCKTWKTRPNDFLLRIKYLNGFRQGFSRYYWFITNCPISDTINTEDHEMGVRYFITGRTKVRFVGTLFNCASNWYTFDPTTVTEEHIAVMRSVLLNLHVPASIVDMPLEQLHDWLLEHPQANQQYYDIPPLYRPPEGMDIDDLFTTPLATINKYMQVERDGLLIPDFHHPREAGLGYNVPGTTR